MTEITVNSARAFALKLTFKKNGVYLQGSNKPFKADAETILLRDTELTLGDLFNLEDIDASAYTEQEYWAVLRVKAEVGNELLDYALERSLNKE